jgi:hypothetical protein
MQVTMAGIPERDAAEQRNEETVERFLSVNCPPWCRTVHIDDRGGEHHHVSEPRMAHSPDGQMQTPLTLESVTTDDGVQSVPVVNVGDETGLDLADLIDQLLLLRDQQRQPPPRTDPGR